MKYCAKCKVKIIGEPAICPLCQADLTHQGIPDDTGREEQGEIFPVIPTVFRQYGTLFRCLIFASVAAAVICLLVNVLLYHSFGWSLYAIGGIGCFWVSMWIAISKRRNLPKNILWQVVAIGSLAVLWDIATGWRGWSLDYVIPGVCTVTVLCMVVLAKVTRIKLRDYIIYLIMDALLGIVPIIFLLTDLVHVMYPSLISIAVSVLSLAALIIFYGGNMKEELDRRLHL